jgi:hypothetical protein
VLTQTQGITAQKNLKAEAGELLNVPSITNSGVSTLEHAWTADSSLLAKTIT